MNILKILIYILSLPLFVFLGLFFQYLLSLNLLLVFSVFLFRDLRKLNLFWLLIFTSLLLDVSMYFWLGTHLLTVSIALFLLLLFDKFVSNFFLDIVAVFFTFLFFQFFFQILIFFQETSTLISMDLNFLNDIVLFAIKNIFVYLILKTLFYFLKSYFREEVF